MDGLNPYDLNDLLNENAAPAGTGNGAETTVAGKSNLVDNCTWDALKQAARWVAWREDQRNDKPVKVPYCSSQRMAKANDPATWMPQARAEAVAAQLLSEGQRGGVGLMLGDGIGGIDLDSCYDAATGALEPWAAEVVERFASYAEVSPSGTGVKVFFTYAADDLPALRELMGTQHGKSWSRGSHCEIALHLGNRYFAFTAQGLPSMPAEMRLADRAALEWLIEDAGPRFKGQAAAVPKGDESRSGRGFRLAGQMKRAGESFEDFAAAARADERIADWAKDERQLQRAWDNAKAPLEIRAEDFADLTEGGTIPDYPADEIPDLSHDQLALDLGRDAFDENARYVAELGGRLLWEGTRWQVAPGMRHMAVVRDYVRSKAASLPRWAEARIKLRRLDDEAASDLLKDAHRWAKGMRQDAFIAAIERLARSNHCSLSRPEAWDAEDMLLGTPGGTVDLRTGELRPADRADHITKNTSVAPAPEGAQPTAWVRFLAEVFPNDPDMPAFIQRLAGYALTGSTREHRLFLFHGSGRNGKGTLLNTLQDIMGDYAKGVPTAALLETRGTQHASPIARLRGARLVRGAELPVGQTWNESLVKQLTGGDTITANLMRQDAFEFTPKFTLIIDGNTKPRIRTTDVAMKARMTLVPFTASFAGREDRGLPERLKAEAGAILRWMIEGAVLWHREGLGIPSAVEAASSDYLASEDMLADFIADEITKDLAGKVTVKDLYQRYLTWCDHERSKPMSKRALSDAMSERGFERAFGAKNISYVYGIALRDPFADADGEA